MTKTKTTAEDLCKVHYFVPSLGLCRSNLLTLQEVSALESRVARMGGYITGVFFAVTAEKVEA